MNNTNIFTNAFRGNLSKQKRSNVENYFHVYYPTHLIPFDYMNGRVYDIRTFNGDRFTYHALGLKEGSISMVVGNTHIGKTTFVLEVVGNIMKDYPNSYCLYEDSEGGADYQRMSDVTGIPIDNLMSRVNLVNVDVTTESFLADAKFHCKQKLELMKSNPKEIMYDTGLMGVDGKPLLKPVPTFIVLDSLAGMISQEIIDAEELTSNMTGMRQAKANGEIIKAMNQLCQASNTILIIINHKNDKVDMGGFVKKAAEISGMGEFSIPGGRTTKYLMTNIIELKHKGLLQDPNKDYGVIGAKVIVNMLKSRSTFSGNKIELILDKAKGYNPYLSALHNMLEAGVVKTKSMGSKGTFCYLPNYPHYYFKKKKDDLFRAMIDDLGFRIAFRNLCEDFYTDFMKRSQLKIEDPSDEFMNMMNEMYESDF